MSTNYSIPKPGDNHINLDEVKGFIDDFEAAQADGDDDEANVCLPFSVEEYICLKELFDQTDHYNCEYAIHEDHFVDYITDLIDDCYDIRRPDEDTWPYRHLTMDYKAAAEEAKEDYVEMEWRGETYLCR